MYKYANISYTSGGAKFRCQFPADAVLADKIPLPATTPISVQSIDCINIFGSSEGFLDEEPDFLPAVRRGFLRRVPEPVGAVGGRLKTWVTAANSAAR